MGQRTTVINDPVHGHIELLPLYMKIIDTPQFQRLRFLKQLGTTYFIFPGAVHTRFEHSIGVCHLAETLCKTLKERQPELNITDEDVQCVAIAGLCHDLGHGLFSHTFDGKFLPELGINWKHEQGSVSMFDYLIKENNLESHFNPLDLVFIKEQIYPPKFKEDEDWVFKGRNKEKSFLYEIVANKRNGIDVDKWDYIARDSYYLGIRTAFDHSRLMKFVRVLEVCGEKQICTRAKEVDSLYELFHSRMCLYRQAYLHKTGLKIDHMICKALQIANEYLTFEKNGKKIKMSESIHDMSVFMKLDDNLFNVILASADPGLEPARVFLRRIISRKLPKLIGRFKFKEDEWTTDEIIKRVCEGEGNKGVLRKNDLIIIKRKIDYGMGVENPINGCWFYNKDKVNEPYQVKKEQVSSFLPDKFIDVQFLLFLDVEDLHKHETARMCYKDVCNKYGLEINMGPEQSLTIITPMKHHVPDEDPDKTKLKRKLDFQETVSPKQKFHL